MYGFNGWQFILLIISIGCSNLFYLGLRLLKIILLRVICGGFRFNDEDRRFSWKGIWVAQLSSCRVMLKGLSSLLASLRLIIFTFVQILPSANPGELNCHGIYRKVPILWLSKASLLFPTIPFPSSQVFPQLALQIFAVTSFLPQDPSKQIDTHSDTPLPFLKPNQHPIDALKWYPDCAKVYTPKNQ